MKKVHAPCLNTLIFQAPIGCTSETTGDPKAEAIADVYSLILGQVHMCGCRFVPGVLCVSLFVRVRFRSKFAGKPHSIRIFEPSLKKPFLFFR